MWHISQGVLSYGPGIRAIVSVERNLADYYYNLIPHYFDFQSPAYEPHITVVRTGIDIPKFMEFWNLYEGKQIDFCYEPFILHDGTYYYLKVWSTRIGDIREELGLPRFRKNELGAEFGCYHFTIANNKKLVSVNRPVVVSEHYQSRCDMMQVVREELKKAIKNRESRKDILRVLLGELQMADITDGPKAHAIVRKLINNNLETSKIACCTGKEKLPTGVTITEVFGRQDEVGKQTRAVFGKIVLNAEGTYFYEVDINNSQVQACYVGTRKDLQELIPYKTSASETSSEFLKIAITPSLIDREKTRKKLALEIEVLQGFLPKYMTMEEIQIALQPILENVRSAPSTGAAVGVAIKYLKGKNVEGGTVKLAVEKLLE